MYIAVLTPCLGGVLLDDYLQMLTIMGNYQLDIIIFTNIRLFNMKYIR